MSERKSSLRWIIGIIVLAACAWGAFKFTRPLPIDVALRDGLVQASFIASGGGGNRVTITLVRPVGAQGSDIKVFIPAGTLLYSRGAEGQRLMTAVPVTIIVGGDRTMASQEVPSFCIDQFAVTPLDGAALNFNGPQHQQSRTIETNLIRKLIDCMASSPLSESDKQLAVWAVSSGWLSKSRQETLQLLTEGLRDQMEKERREQLNAKKPQIVAMMPLLGSARIDELIEAEMQGGMDALRSIATDTANKQLASFLKNDKPLLLSCGYKEEDMPVFH